MSEFKRLLMRRDALQIILTYSNLCADCVEVVQRDLDWTISEIEKYVSENPVIKE